jgi:hypothetical protein
MKSLDEIHRDNVRTTATVGGKITNRVRRVRSARTKRTKALARRSPQRAKLAYAKDPSTRGLDYVQVCVCMPVAELAVLDDMADRAQMARSHFIRQAVKHFSAKVFP